ncbi:LPS translocon maturation chaperone LptM [Acidithiobacillus caldus]
MRRDLPFLRFLLVSSLLLGLAGCGRKTPLQLPPTPSPHTAHSASPSHPAAS